MFYNYKYCGNPKKSKKLKVFSKKVQQVSRLAQILAYKKTRNYGINTAQQHSPFIYSVPPCFFSHAV